MKRLIIPLLTILATPLAAHHTGFAPAYDEFAEPIPDPQPLIRIRAGSTPMVVGCPYKIEDTYAAMRSVEERDIPLVDHMEAVHLCRIVFDGAIGTIIGWDRGSHWQVQFSDGLEAVWILPEFIVSIDGTLSGAGMYRRYTTTGSFEP